MFKVGSQTSLKQAAITVDKGYVLSKSDVLSFRVFTKNGERIVDPDNKLDVESSVAQNQTNAGKLEKFVIDLNGVAKLPMLGELKLEGLTLREAELLLQKEFLKFYSDVFVIVECTSHRVIVLGAPGGQVIPLVHDNTTLVEVIALSKGFVVEGKAAEIRLLRGDDIILIDFSTVEGYQKSNIIVQPGDVLYIEPVRRPFVEALRDYGPFVTLLSTITTLFIVATK